MLQDQAIEDQMRFVERAESRGLNQERPISGIDKVNHIERLNHTAPAAPVNSWRRTPRSTPLESERREAACLPPHHPVTGLSRSHLVSPPTRIEPPQSRPRSNYKRLEQKFQREDAARKACNVYKGAYTDIYRSPIEQQVHDYNESKKKFIGGTFRNYSGVASQLPLRPVVLQRHGEYITDMNPDVKPAVRLAVRDQVRSHHVCHHIIALFIIYHLFVYIFIHLFVYIFIHLFVYSFIYFVQDKSKHIGGAWVAPHASARKGHAPGMSIAVNIEDSIDMSTSIM